MSNWHDSTIASIITGLLVFLGVLADAHADCPQAEQLRQRGELVEAERAARDCLDEEPKNAEVWMELSRVLASRGSYDGALEWVDRAIDKHGEDMDLHVWRARVLYWGGDAEKAQREIEQLPATVKERRDVLLLRADVAFAADDTEEAISLYDRYLEDNPEDPHALYRRGLAYQELNAYGPARTSLEASCSIDPTGSEACAALTSLRRETPPNYYAIFRPGYMYALDRPDGYSLEAVLGADLTRQLSLAASAEWRARGFRDGERLSDFVMGLDGRWRFTQNFRLDFGGGGSPDAEFTPVWEAYVEPGYSFDFGLDLEARYWRIQFEPAGVHVINPSARFTWRRAFVDARYYLGIEDQDLGLGDGQNDVTHSTLLRLGYYLGQRSHVYAGGGFGDRSDYLEVRQPLSEFHWLALAGVHWEFVPTNTLMLDYIYRNEDLGAQTYQHHQTFLGYRKDFW